MENKDAQESDANRRDDNGRNLKLSDLHERQIIIIIYLMFTVQSLISCHTHIHSHTLQGVQPTAAPATFSRGGFSTAVHPKHQEAEEHSDSDQRDGGRRGEELPVVDAEVPHHGQDDHEHRHHQAARADGHAGGSESSREPRPGRRRLGPLLGRGLQQRLGDVAVDDAVVRDVEREQSPLGILQQLALVDEFDLVLATREVLAAGGRRQKAGGETAGNEAVWCHREANRSQNIFYTSLTTIWGCFAR